MTRRIIFFAFLILAMLSMAHATVVVCKLCFLHIMHRPLEPLYAWATGIFSFYLIVKYAHAEMMRLSNYIQSLRDKANQ